MNIQLNLVAVQNKHSKKIEELNKSKSVKDMSSE